MRSHRFIALIALLLVFTVPSVSLSETYTDAEVQERYNKILMGSPTQNLTAKELEDRYNEIVRKSEMQNSTADDKASENTSQENSENIENKSVKGSTTGQGKKTTIGQGKNRKGGGKSLDKKQEITPKPAPATVELTGLPTQAEYRITKWDLNGNITLEIQPKDGQKVPPAEGNPAVLNGRVVSLRVPIEFTLPNGVEVVQIALDPANNYKILDDGSLSEFKKSQGRDERGNIHSDRATNPGDSVLMLLMLNKGVMTVLRLPY